MTLVDHYEAMRVFVPLVYVIALLISALAPKSNRALSALQDMLTTPVSFVFQIMTICAALCLWPLSSNSTFIIGIMGVRFALLLPLYAIYLRKKNDISIQHVYLQEMLNHVFPLVACSLIVCVAVVLSIFG